MCYLELGNFNRCMQVLDGWEELVFSAGMQSGQIESYLMNIEATVYQEKTEYSKARCVHEAILRQTSVVLFPTAHAYTISNIVFLDIVTGASADVAFHNLNAASTIFRNVHYPHGISVCHLWHADLRLREGDASGARVEYIQLFTLTRNYNDTMSCSCLERLADTTNPVDPDTESARWGTYSNP